MKALKTLLLALALIGSGISFGQTDAELYKQGIKAKRSIKNVAMYNAFTKLYKKDSTKLEYIFNMSIAYTRVGANKATQAEQLKYYTKAIRLAKKAIKMKETSAGAHYAFALALGRENEYAKNKQKIANGEEIKNACERAIELDPSAAGVYHILGRWHRTIAGFNGFEKTMMNTFYGGAPEGGTYKDALLMFQKAIKLEPWYMLHMHELAQTYYEMGKTDLAKKYNNKAMTLPTGHDDAAMALKKCKALDKKLK